MKNDTDHPVGQAHLPVDRKIEGNRVGKIGEIQGKGHRQGIEFAFGRPHGQKAKEDGDHSPDPNAKSGRKDAVAANGIC